jgi:hypothetical protein
MTMMRTIPNRLMNRQRNRGFDMNIIDGLGCVHVPLSDCSAGCLSSSNRSCSLSWTDSISLLLELDTETLPEELKSLRRLNRYRPSLWPFPKQKSIAIHDCSQARHCGLRNHVSVYQIPVS